jgi:hypothetical protein
MLFYGLCSESPYLTFSYKLTSGTDELLWDYVLRVSHSYWIAESLSVLPNLIPFHPNWSVLYVAFWWLLHYILATPVSAAFFIETIKYCICQRFHIINANLETKQDVTMNLSPQIGAIFRAMQTMSVREYFAWSKITIVLVVHIDPDHCERYSLQSTKTIYSDQKYPWSQISEAIPISSSWAI